jgi:hypothetical protein
MVTAQRQRLVIPHPPASALAAALKRPEPAAPPRVRAIPKSRRREYQAWMTLLIAGSGLLLALGVLSLYGRIIQTQEINRRSNLNVQLKVAKQRSEEITLQRATLETDANIALQAARFKMIRRTDRDAVTIP